VAQRTSADLPYPCDWHGLNFLDGLAAEFPDVIDYYLHDNADRLAVVVAQMTSIMGMRPTEDAAGHMSPKQVGDYLAEVQPLLNSEPHFIYEVTVGPFKQTIEAEPDLIVATTWGTPGSDGGSVTVKVFARFEAALSFRPIPIKLEINAEPGSELHGNLEQFSKFGTPFAAPNGTTDITINMPGELGGSFTGGAVQVGPAHSEQDGGYVIRLVTVDSESNTVESVLMDMNPISTGFDRTGVRAHGTDQGRALDLEILTDLRTTAVSFNIVTRDLTGCRPSDVLPGIRFIRSMHQPNGLTVAQEFGPITSPPLALEGASLDLEAIDPQLRILNAFADLQELTTVQIVVPARESIDANELWWWNAGTRLLRGETITLGQTSTQCCLPPGAEPPVGQFAIAGEAEVAIHVGEQVVDVGKMITHSAAAEVVPDSGVQHDDHLDVTIRTAEGVKTTARLAATSEEFSGPA